MNKEKKRIGILAPAQYWIELHGTFNSNELREIAIKIENNIKKLNGNKKRHIN